MSADIVYDLLNLHAPGHTNYTCLKAADEIKQLRAELAAARADATLLRSSLIDIAAVMWMSSLPSYSEWEKIRNKALQLVAALAVEKK